MNVISRRALAEFYDDHGDVKDALETWYRICKKAIWRNFHDVRKTYPAADVVGDDRMVFNIKGNRYRLVARFSFRYKAVQVKWIGTHAKYNEIDVLKV